MRKLTLEDILDTRAYEREREAFRADVIAMKKRRRIELGDFITLVFENIETMRFQIQEMARIENMATDEKIQHEVDTYNELIPEAGELSATLFIELDDKEKLYEWLPKLVGIQDAVAFWFPDGSQVRSFSRDVERLTREEEITTTVHYVRFQFSENQAAAMREPGVRLVVDHPNYEAITELTDDQRLELAGDLLD